MDSTQWPRLNYTKCINGKAEAVPGNPLLTFKCKNVWSSSHIEGLPNQMD